MSQKSPQARPASTPPAATPGAPPASAASVKDRVGKYPISHKLGQGGMGEVWLGRHPDLDIPVAVKTLPTLLVARNPGFLERFIKEARTAAKINHPNVVRIYDAGVDDDVNFIVMEYVEGGTVKDLQTQAQGPLTPDLALNIVIQVAEALRAAAEYGIIHRDIKPENIMLDRKGTAKLADLGLAKQIESADELSVTAPGSAMGTPNYISPEQVQDAKNVDARADIYSLGATFYHLVTGDTPFSAASSFELMLKHVQEPLPPPGDRNPQVPPGISTVICKMMHKRPDDRYASAAVLLEDLYRLKYGTITPPAPGTVPPTAAPIVPAGRRRPALLVATAAALLALVLLVVAVKFWPSRYAPASDPEPRRAGQPSANELAMAKLLEEARAKADAEAKRAAQLKDEAEAKVQAEALARQQAEAEAKARTQALALAEADAKRATAEKRKAEIEAEAARQAQAKAEAEARRAQVEKDQAEADKRATAQRLAAVAEKAAADARQAAKLRDEAEARAKREAEAKTKAEADAAKATAEAERLAAENRRAEAAAARARAEKEQAEIENRADAQRLAAVAEKAAADARQAAKLKDEAEARAKREAEAKTKAEADAAKAKAEAERLAEENRRAEAAAARARAEKEQAEAEKRADAERLAAAAEKAAADARQAAKLKDEAEARAKREADAKAKAEADAAKAKAAAEHAAEETRRAEAAAITRAETERRAAAAAALAAQQAKTETKLPLPSPAVPTPGQHFTVPNLNLTLVFIPSAKFTMGSKTTEWGRDPNETAHQVTITRPFWMSQHELTRQEFKALMGRAPGAAPAAPAPAAPAPAPVDGDAPPAAAPAPAPREPPLPALGITWDEAVAAAAKLTATERAADRLPAGYVYRLPTEAEWEYACRAGSADAYCFGSGNARLIEFAVFAGPGVRGPQPVGTKKPNAWGLYDMHGNAREWCLDAGDTNRRDGVVTDTYRDGTLDPLSTKGRLRLTRGGSWKTTGSDCRCAQRVAATPAKPGPDQGVRFVLGPELK